MVTVTGNPSSDDYYSVLGVSKTATQDQIKRAYRREAMRWHPDKNPGEKQARAAENFKAVGEAYAVLSDQQERATYDNYGKEGARAAKQASGCGGGGGFGGPGSGMPFNFGGPGVGTTFSFSTGAPGAAGGGGGFSHSDAEALFSQLFGGGGSNGFAGDGGGGGGGGFTGTGMMGGLGGLFGGMAGMPVGFGGTGVPPGRSRAKRRRAAEASPFCRHPPGTGVILTGLATRPDLNGRHGTVQHFGSDGRYAVTVDSTQRTGGGGPELVSVRAECVVAIIRGVVLSDIKSQPTINGECGTIIGFHRGSGRYQIRLDRGGATVAVRAPNITWPKGTALQLSGLANTAQHNGRWGEVLSFDSDGRYTLKLDPHGAELLRVRPYNIGAAPLVAVS